ncbi:MAG: succinylglutamate desuccinylase/aspartoacylase family protein [Bacteroidota bacterium]
MTLQKDQKGPHTVYRIEAKDEGVNILVFGAVHGNEPCGPMGIENFLNSFEGPLKKGSVTFIPICNPRAYEDNKRFYYSDLNRAFGDNAPKDEYERELIANLKSHIDACDILLDIHSYQRETVPFILNDKNTKVNNAWVQSLSPNIVVTGWDVLYPNGGDTNAYAHKKGKHALTVECGQHDDECAPQVAESIIKDTLAHFSAIEGKPIEKVDKQQFTMKQLIRKPSDKADFIQDWQNFDVIDPNVPLYMNGDEAFYYKEDNCFIFMPKPLAKADDEWFYIVENTIQAHHFDKAI